MGCDFFSIRSVSGAVKQHGKKPKRNGSIGFETSDRFGGYDIGEPPTTSHLIEPLDRHCLEVFKDRLAEVKNGNRMFRTTKHYLGMGRVSSQRGGEIWILRCATFPLFYINFTMVLGRLLENVLFMELCMVKLYEERVTVFEKSDSLLIVV